VHGPFGHSTLSTVVVAFATPSGMRSASAGDATGEHGGEEGRPPRAHSAAASTTRVRRPARSATSPTAAADEASKKRKHVRRGDAERPQALEPVPLRPDRLRSGDRLARPALRLVGEALARREQAAAALVSLSDEELAVGRLRHAVRSRDPDAQSPTRSASSH
jgi:hypothetical protein